MTRWLLVVLVGTACEPQRWDPATGDWPELAVREVDPLLGGSPVQVLSDDETWGVEEHPDIVRLWGSLSERYGLFAVKQPVDWADPYGPWFYQRFTLALYDGYYQGPFDGPVVLETLGYDLGSFGDVLDSRHELELLLGGMVVTLEHRYFGNSWPDTDDMHPLSSSQAAADANRLIALLRPNLLPGPWVATGASKGGMTATQLHYFFPDAVDAVVAYVAPFQRGAVDERAAPWFTGIGDAACRSAVANFADAALDYTHEVGGHYSRLAGEETTDAARATYAHGVLHWEWGIWQYRSYYGCDDVEPFASAEEAIAWVRPAYNRIEAPFNGADAFYTRFGYDWQALREHGLPGAASTRGLGRIPWVREPPELGASNVQSPDFDPSLQDHLAWWFEHSARNILAVYGEWDPWTYAAIPEVPGVHTIMVPERDHGANLFDLDGDTRQEPLDLLREWMGLPLEAPIASTWSEADHEADAQRRAKGAWPAWRRPETDLRAFPEWAHLDTMPFSPALSEDPR